MTLGQFSTFLWIRHYTNDVLLYCSAGSTVGTYTCEIASGCVLIYSVYKVVTYLHETEDSQERLNLQTLVIHSGSFGLFLLSTALLISLYLLVFFLPSKYKAALVSNSIY